MKYYTLNPRFIADIFDETIIIANLDSGIYYTISGAICNVFTDFNLEKSKVLELVSSKLDIKDVFDQLIEEQIIIESTNSIELDLKGLKEPKGESKLKKFDDLQDLLVLDPIHEIDENLLD